MNCPECGSICWRDGVDVGVGMIWDIWSCTVCDWDEDQAFPMNDKNWEEFLNPNEKDDGK